MSTLDKKLELWRHKLLDLGRRNRMLNYRQSKLSTLTVSSPDIFTLFKHVVVDGDRMSFTRPVERMTDPQTFYVLSLFEELLQPIPARIGDINTERSIKEQYDALKNLRAKSHLAIDEQGINILYLAFGFLTWRDINSGELLIETGEEDWQDSPLIMVPVALTRESVGAPYVIKRTDDDIVVNPTLAYCLKSRHNIDLPPFDADEDDLNEYFANLAEISAKSGWSVRQDVCLGLFSFQKINMYKDLLNNEERLIENPIIRALGGDTAALNGFDASVFSHNPDNVASTDCFQVVNADSSQQEAIELARRGVSFVMQGPPGTGKSQTITNIIAEALADGKKVLFVSEKMAALQVVYRRLQEVRLADFCLPLHDSKANKREVLNEIGRMFDLSMQRVTDDALVSLCELDTKRQALNDYSRELHEVVSPLNISAYDAYGVLSGLTEYDTLAFDFANIKDITAAQLREIMINLREHTATLQALGEENLHGAWSDTCLKSTGHELTEKITRDFVAFSHALIKCANAINMLCATYGLRRDCLAWNMLETLKDVILSAPDIDFPSAWTDGALPISEIEKRITAMRDELIRYKNAYSFIVNHGAADMLDDKNVSRSSVTAGDALSTLQKLLLPHDSVSAYLSAHTEMQELFTQASVLMQNMEISREICKMPANCLADAKNIVAFVDALRAHKPVRAELFSGDTRARARAALAELSGFFNTVSAAKARLKAEFEEEIFTLDYKPILMRYKTEYKTIAKLVKPTYSADRKSVIALTKGKGSKLSDEEIFDALILLNEIDRTENTVSANSARYSELFGERFNGINTDINALAAENADADAFMSKVSGLHLSDAARLIAVPENAALRDKLTALDFSGVAKVCDLTSKHLPGNPALTEIISTAKAAVTAINTARDALSPYVNANIDYADALLLTRYVRLCQITAAKYADDSAAGELLGAMYDGVNTDCAAALNNLKTLSDFTGSDAAVRCSKTFVKKMLSDKRCRADAQTTADVAATLLNDFSACFEWIETLFLPSAGLRRVELKTLAEKLTACAAKPELLDKQIEYNEKRARCVGVGLENFLIAFESAALPVEDMVGTFCAGFYRRWLDNVCEEKEALNCFRARAHNETVKDFRSLDAKQLSIAQFRIREKLISMLPAEQTCRSERDEVAILRHELEKKRRIMPLRLLFGKIPNLLPTLKPCLMMSPLSVSYFLEAKTYKFDMVIFDEASQIFPEDAIGAILRGAQVIIAGDSKQLPPTNFFVAADTDTTDYDDESKDSYDEVCDSILEEANACMPSCRLSWHYRSKHEQLIAFSNAAFYNNKLITFPASVDSAPDIGVELAYTLDGVYENRANVVEARHCVELVERHIQAHPERSLGIIAFSERQQGVIEEEMERFMAAHPEYRDFFDRHADAPFFVKNLENVQGDERDTIIFSVCYGKNSDGRMYMRFGPLGVDGGERRLNVAISRAKYNVKLVCSVTPFDIDPTRVKAAGVLMLRDYIDFAASHTLNIAPTDEAPIFEDALRDNIAELLIKNGYMVTKNVGCSKYKIDIALSKSETPQQYFAGIEVDGHTYAAQKTARDRDHLPHDVLESMGWRLYRVWAADWVKNPVSAKTELLNFVRESASNYALDLAPQEPPEVSNADDDAIVENEVAPAARVRKKKSAQYNPYDLAYYREADITRARVADDLDNATKVAEYVRYVVKTEQPVHIETVAKRMMPLFGTGKVTDAVKKTIAVSVKKRLVGEVALDDSGYMYMLPRMEIVPRIPREGEPVRAIEYVHIGEIAACMLKVIQTTFGITQEDLIAECALAFGMKRKSAKYRGAAEAALSYLIDCGIAEIADDKVRIIGDTRIMP